MKSFIVCALLVFVSVNCYRVERSPMSPAEETLTLLGQMKTNNELPAVASHPEQFDKFEKFIRDFKKSYATKEELSKRFTIFVDNLKTIEKLNKSEHGSATYGINHLADLTKEELRGGLNLNLGKDKLKPDPSP